MKLAITGANSSVGRNLLTEIASQNEFSAVAGVRSSRSMESLPGAPGITPALIDYADTGGMTEVFTGADCVVHLAGVLFPGRGDSYRKANVETTAAVVEAARRAQVARVLFVSVVGADPASKNPYWRSKGEAEELVHASGLAATVLRTPMLLGPDTAGGQSLAATASRSTARVPGGGRYQVRPLDVDDLSAAILQSCRQPPGNQATHELVGPEPLSYADLIRRMAAAIGNDIRIASIPVAGLRLIAAASHAIKRAGISPAILEVITADETVSHNADSDLGVQLTPLAETLEKIANNSRGNS